MAIHTKADNGLALSASTTRSKKLIGGPTFDVVFLLFLTWYLAGSITDFWAHNHIPGLETFFTPWHGLLYTGYGATSLSLIFVVIFNRIRSGTWSGVIPAGYALSVLAVAGFTAGGIGDMFWHMAFGIEKNIDAQFSPSHVVLLVFGGLFATGPYRSAYLRKGQPNNLRMWLLTLCSITIFFLFMGLTTQIGHPYGHGYTWPTTFTAEDLHGQSRAVMSYLIVSFILVGMTLYTVRRWRLPFGSFLFIQLLTALPLSFVRDHFLATAIGAAAGLLMDFAYLWLKPSVKRVDQFRLFSVLVPTIFFGVFFLTLLLTDTITWSIHLSIGTIVAIAMLGWLMSYMFIPGETPSVASWTNETDTPATAPAPKEEPVQTKSGDKKDAEE